MPTTDTDDARPGDDDLLTMQDIADMLGLSYTRVRTLRSGGTGRDQAKLPPPDLQPSARTILWRRGTIRRWNEAGRPAPADQAE